MLFSWFPGSLVQLKGRACSRKRLLSVTACQFICGRRSYLSGSQDLKGKVWRNLHCSPPLYWFLMNLKVENKSFDHESHGHGHHHIPSSVSKNMEQSGTAGEIRSRGGSHASVSQIPTCSFSSFWTINFYPLQSPHLPVLLKWGEIVHWEWLGLSNPHDTASNQKRLLPSEAMLFGL